MQKCRLLLSVFGQIRCLPAPADIGLSADNPGAGTGRINEDGIKRRRFFPAQGGKCSLQRPNLFFMAKTVDILQQKAVAMRIRLQRKHRAASWQQFHQMAGLAAQTGAGIQYLAGTRQAGQKQRQ